MGRRRNGLTGARALAVGVLALLTGACHVYRPVSRAPEPGTDVRVRLTAPGALELSRETDEPRRRYEGRLMGNRPDTLTLSVVQARNVSDFQRTRTLRNNVEIPRSYVERLEVRELSGWRTSVVAAAGMGLAGFLIQRAASGGGGSEDAPGEGGGPVAAVIPFAVTPP